MIAVAESSARSALPPQIQILDWESYLGLWRWKNEPRRELPPSPPPEAEPLSAIEGKRRQTPGNPPGPLPTRPVVRDAVSARAEAAAVASTFVPGEASLYFAKWPGVGGTTAFARQAAENLAARVPGWEVGITVVALPTRGLVAEKARATRAHVEQHGLNVLVSELLGKSADPTSGWHCAGEQFAARATLHRELNRSSCVGCPARDLCEEKPGLYRYERKRVLEAIKKAKRGEGPPVLLFTTHASLPTLWQDVPRKVPIVLDEAGDLFGLVLELEIPWSEIDTARENAREFIESELGEGRTISGARARWREWAASAPARKAATDKLRSGWLKSHDIMFASGRAVEWAGSCKLDPGRARSLVTKHWPNAKKVLRALIAYGRSQDVLPDILAADLVARILEVILKSPVGPRKTPFGAKQNQAKQRKLPALGALARWLRLQRRLLERTVGRLPEEYRRALVEKKVRPPMVGDGIAAWPWEEIKDHDGEDLRPAFSSIAIEVACEALEAHAPLIRRRRRVVCICLSDRELIQRAKAGRVAWIGVGPMPCQVGEALSARQERVLALPDRLRVVVLSRLRGPRWATFGRGLRHRVVKGKRMPCPSWEDEATRDLSGKLAERAAAGTLTFRGRPVRSFRAVVHQRDWDAMGRPAWARYYNAGHEGTDALIDGEMLLVRRWTPPFSECVLVAEVLRRALDIPRPSCGTGLLDVENRRWWYGPAGSEEDISTACLTDPLEREVQRFFELQGMLNAIGRCRPLSAGPEGRVVVFLNGRPLDWLPVTDGPFDILGPGVAAMLGVEVEIPSEKGREEARIAREERDAQRATERQERLQVLLGEVSEAGVAMPSQRQLAARLRTSAKTLRRDLEELGSHGGTREAGPVAELRARLAIVLRGLREALRKVSRAGDRGLESVAPAVSEVGHDPYGCLVGSAPHDGHLVALPLPEKDLELLPSASAIQKELSAGTGRRLTDRTVHRQLVEIRRALLGEVEAVCPRRSDKRSSLGAVLRSCVSLLERQEAERPLAALRLVAPELPFASPSEGKPPPATVAPPGCANVEDVEPSETASVGTVSYAPSWSPDGCCEDCFEVLEERAAILEFDAGFTRMEAEIRAWDEVFAGTEARP